MPHTLVVHDQYILYFSDAHIIIFHYYILFILLEAIHLKIYTEATKFLTFPHTDTYYWFLHCGLIPTKLNTNMRSCSEAQCNVWDTATTRTQYSWLLISMLTNHAFSRRVWSSVYKRKPRNMTRRKNSTEHVKPEMEKEISSLNFKKQTW